MAKKTTSIGHSKAIEEIVSKPPTWAVKYSTYMLIATLNIVFLLSFLVQYNDVVEGKILVSTENPIVGLKAKISGEVENIFVKNGDTVKVGDVLAKLKSTAKYEDVLEVKKMLASLEKHLLVSVNNIDKYYPSDLRLGDLQEKYLAFFMKHNEYLANDSLTPLIKNNENATKRLVNQRNLLKSQQRQLSIIKEKIAISIKNINRNATLLEKGVISNQDYEAILNVHLDLLNEEEILRSNIYQKEITLGKIKALVNETRLNELTYGRSNDRIYQESFQSLQNDIIKWENKYLIIAPIEGVVNSHAVWGAYQNVLIDQTLFSIVPIAPGIGVGLVEIPIKRFAKIKVGQRVVIKLNSYPYQQYGYLTGIITGLSSIPDQNLQEYTVFVKIPSLTTNQNNSVLLNQQLIGKAQVITEKLSLAERLFYSFRKIIDPNK